MDGVTVCCKNTYSGGLEPSPFERLIALEYYDGPTRGVLKCRDCEQAFIFTMLDIDAEGKYDRASWNVGREVRVFGLSDLPASSFEEIIRVCSRYAAPTWPAWLPVFRTTDTIENLNALESETQHILDRTEVVRVVVATHDLLADVVAARNVSGDDPAGMRDWFLFLGLTEDPSHLA